MMGSMVETWRQFILGSEKSWALFEHGTCVILMVPEADLQRQAAELMRKWGPVHGGTPAGDFSVIELLEHAGWVVTGHHPDILNYIAPDEVETGTSDAIIGLLGRSKRHQDAEGLRIIHIEDKRGDS
jgi:hypothetical protein